MTKAIAKQCKNMTDIFGMKASIEARDAHPDNNASRRGTVQMRAGKPSALTFSLTLMSVILRTSHFALFILHSDRGH